MEPLTNQLTGFPHGIQYTPCSEKKGGDSSEKGERGGGSGAPTEQIPGTQNAVHHVQYINFNDGKRGRGGGGRGGLKRTCEERVEKKCWRWKELRKEENRIRSRRYRSKSRSRSRSRR